MKSNLTSLYFQISNQRFYLGLGSQKVFQTFECFERSVQRKLTVAETDPNSSKKETKLFIALACIQSLPVKLTTMTTSTTTPTLAGLWPRQLLRASIRRVTPFSLSLSLSLSLILILCFQPPGFLLTMRFQSTSKIRVKKRDMVSTPMRSKIKLH